MVLVILLSTFMTLNAQNVSYWQDIPRQNIQTQGERVIIPQEYRTLTLNIPEIKTVLNSAPQEKNVFASNSNTILYLPLPDGGFGRFRITDSPVMEEALAIKYQEIKTYTAQGVDDPYASAKIDITPSGFHAMILTAGSTIFIDPYAKGDIYNYISYYKSNLIPRNDFHCDVVSKEDDAKHEHGKTRVMLEGQLRTYRTAIATTGEYTTFHGGTVAAGLAAVVTALNRVNGVYEKEASIRMVLIANNDLLIYTNASTDPYSNTNGNAMLSQNITTCNNIIGSANFDIGHVFSTEIGRASCRERVSSPV